MEQNHCLKLRAEVAHLKKIILVARKKFTAAKKRIDGLFNTRKHYHIHRLPYRISKYAKRMTRDVVYLKKRIISFKKQLALVNQFHNKPLHRKGMRRYLLHVSTQEVIKLRHLLSNTHSKQLVMLTPAQRLRLLKLLAAGT